MADEEQKTKILEQLIFFDWCVIYLPIKFNLYLLSKSFDNLNNNI